MYTYKIIYHCSDFEQPQEYLYKGTTLMNAINHAKKFLAFMQENNRTSFYELITVVDG
jgi:uncharacterized protein Usg